MSGCTQIDISLPLNKVRALDDELIWAIYNLITEALCRFNSEKLVALSEKLRSNNLDFVAASLKRDTRRIRVSSHEAMLKLYQQAVLSITCEIGYGCW